MLFQRESDVATRCSMRCAGDVTVYRLTRRSAEERDACADKLRAVVRTCHVVARLSECAQELRRHRRVLGIWPPDRVIEPVHAFEAAQIGDLAHLYCRRASRGLGCCYGTSGR